MECVIWKVVLEPSHCRNTSVNRYIAVLGGAQSTFASIIPEVLFSERLLSTDQRRLEGYVIRLPNSRVEYSQPCYKA
jgi:hypothetical protein